MKLQLALRLLLLVALQLYHLPPLFPLDSNSSCLFTRCHLLYASCCTVLYFSRYYTVRIKMFIFHVCFFLMCYLCEKYFKPSAVQYYITDCLSWLPGLTLLDLGTQCQNGTCSYVGDLLNWLFYHFLHFH